MSPFDSIMSQYHLTNANLLDFILVCSLLFASIYIFYKINTTKDEIEYIRQKDNIETKVNSEIIEFLENKIKIYKLILQTNLLLLGIMIMKQFL